MRLSIIYAIGAYAIAAAAIIGAIRGDYVLVALLGLPALALGIAGYAIEVAHEAAEERRARRHHPTRAHHNAGARWTDDRPDLDQ